MARKKGAERVPKELSKTFYDMYRIGVRVGAIAKHYKMPQPSVSSIVHRLRKQQLQKKIGRPRKLSERGIRLLQKYVLQHCLESLYVITARFNEYTKLHLSINAIREYIQKINMAPYISVRKSFLSKQNLHSRNLWARTHQDWTMEQWANVAFTDESSFLPVLPAVRNMEIKQRRIHH